MALFSKRTLSPRERFECALREKQAGRENLAERLNAAEAILGQRRDAAERLAITGATDAQLDRAETEMRAAEDRANTLRAALGQLDEQIVATERELADAKAQRDRDMMADELGRMVAAIERAAPGFDNGATALVAAVTQNAASVLEATNFAANVDAVRREVLLAAQVVCAGLRSTAVRTRAGNTNIASPASEPEPLRPSENEHQLVYTLNPLLWRENGKVRNVPAFARIDLPKKLLLVALRHQHVDYLNARRVQTLMKVHGSGQFQAPPHAADPRLVDLDALAAREQESAKADHAA
ncbi:MAG TPA: hypothetical protein VEH02_02320 [Pseudolabrys sp.]|nr:hypothetical protein [Pseudolabrys sp.]